MVKPWKSSQSALRLTKHVRTRGWVIVTTYSFLYTQTALDFVWWILTITHGYPFPDSLISYQNTQNEFWQGLIDERFWNSLFSDGRPEEGIPGRRGLWRWGDLVPVVPTSRCFLSTAVFPDAEAFFSPHLQIYSESTLQLKAPASLHSPSPQARRATCIDAWDNGSPALSDSFLIPYLWSPSPHWLIISEDRVTQSHWAQDLHVPRPLQSCNGLISVHQASLEFLVLWGKRISSLHAVPRGNSALCLLQA